MLRYVQTRALSSQVRAMSSGHSMVQTSMANQCKYQSNEYDLANQTPPVEVYGKMPSPMYLGAVSGQEAQVSVMGNGVTVASVEAGGGLTKLGVFCKGGSSTESSVNAGIASLLRHAWFGSTGRRTIIGATREPAQCGADISVTSTRETFGVITACQTDKTDLILDHMTQSLICPEFWYHELLDAKSKARAENTTAMGNASVALLEEAHKVAFGGKGLGRSMFLKPYSNQLETEECMEYVQTQLAPADNVFIVGQGIDHQTLIHMADEYTWMLKPGSVAKPEPVYCGGRDSHIETGGEMISAMLLTKGMPASSKEAIALDIVKHIVGAGGSAVHKGASNSRLTFRAGEHLSLPYSTSCVNIGYSDTGLFGLSVTAHNTEIGPLLKSGIEVMSGVINSCGEEDLAIAKSKLTASIVLADDSLSRMERTANSLMGYGASESQTLAMIEEITVADVSSALKAVWASDPILVSIGNQEHRPALKELL